MASLASLVKPFNLKAIEIKYHPEFTGVSTKWFYRESCNLCKHYQISRFWIDGFEKLPWVSVIFTFSIRKFMTMIMPNIQNI